MRYLLNSELMKQADQFTIEEKGVPSLELMERAARQCVEYIKKRQLDNSNVCIICGTGNNGGDGFAIARLLRAAGAQVKAVLVGEEDKCSEETVSQIKSYRSAGGTVIPYFEKGNYSLIIDALFGIGLSREVKGQYASVIEDMNGSRGFKLAVDIPSGICGDSGVVMGTAFMTDATVTFQVEKTGMAFYPGKEYAGQVTVVDIGIDVESQIRQMSALSVGEAEDYQALLPNRSEDANKGTYGKVLLIAGSKGMSGAAYLAAKAAYKVGAGLVQIYTAEENRVILQMLLPEAIIKTYDFFDEGELIHLLRWADIVSIGSGTGTGEKAWKLLKCVLENAQVPCVIDADGLNLLAEHKKYIGRLPHGNFIFTPHMKEMERLTGIPIAAIKTDRISILKEFTEKYGMTCILKDSRTVTASPEKLPILNITGNQALAKAGSGDVLAGITAGLLAQGLSCHTAAVLAAYLHGKAGDFAREDLGIYSVMASDLMDYISMAMNS